MPFASATFNDLEVMSRTLWGEARGESFAGQLAVGWVIINRVIDGKKRWPTTIAGVCLQPLQFSCWNPNDPNCKQIAADQLLLSRESFAKMTKLCLAILMGTYDDPTGHANQYYNPDVSDPSWAYVNQKKEQGLVPRSAIIGRHHFLCL
jgi:N-acetylmuramoyl-L-alanine amidase